jgi:hypothetical protein
MAVHIQVRPDPLAHCGGADRDGSDGRSASCALRATGRRLEFFNSKGRAAMAMIALLIVHGLLAVALLGAITHQLVAVWWPAHAVAGNFVGRFRAVPSTTYVGAIVMLYLVTAVLGAIIYTHYTISARVAIIQLQLWKPYGLFEMKEHFAAIGLGVLPAYWYFWQPAVANQYPRVRAVLTALLAFVVWWNFLVGHIINNIRGF